MEFLLDSHNWPFGSALVLLMLIAMFEGMGMLIGSSPSSWLEGIFPDLGDSALDSLGWLHVGKVPMLILFVASPMIGRFSEKQIGFELEPIEHGLVRTFTFQG